MESPVITQQQRRQYRALAATTITNLRKQQPQVPFDEPDWQTLDALPHWCVLEAAPLRQLQRLAGIVFLQPLLQKCIDGQLLKDVAQLVGQQTMRQLMQADAVVPASELSLTALLDDAGNIESLIDGCGASVLLGVVKDESMRALFACRLASTRGELGFAVAEPIFVRAAQHQGQRD